MDTAERYTEANLKELKAIWRNAIAFEARLRIAGLLSSEDIIVFNTFMELLREEIYEIEFIIELEKILSD